MPSVIAQPFIQFLKPKVWKWYLIPFFLPISYPNPSALPSKYVFFHPSTFSQLPYLHPDPNHLANALASCLFSLLPLLLLCNPILTSSQMIFNTVGFLSPLGLKCLIHFSNAFRISPNSSPQQKKTLCDLARSHLSDLVSSHSSPMFTNLQSPCPSFHSSDTTSFLFQGLFTCHSLCPVCSAPGGLIAHIFISFKPHLKCDFRDTLPDHPSKVAPPQSFPFIVLTVVITM